MEAHGGGLRLARGYLALSDRCGCGRRFDKPHGSHGSFISCAQVGASVVVNERRETRDEIRRSSLKVRNFPWVIGALLVVLFAGGIGFWLGVGANAVPVAAPVAGTPVVYAGGWHGFGFPFFGFFFFLFFMFVIFGIIRRVAWGGRGPGRGLYGSGPGGHDWNSKEVPPFAEDMLRSWHRRAHREMPPDDPPSSLTLPKDPV